MAQACRHAVMQARGRRHALPDHLSLCPLPPSLHLRAWRVPARVVCAPAPAAGISLQDPDARPPLTPGRLRAGLWPHLPASSACTCLWGVCQFPCIFFFATLGFKSVDSGWGGIERACRGIRSRRAARWRQYRFCDSSVPASPRGGRWTPGCGPGKSMTTGRQRRRQAGDCTGARGREWARAQPQAGAAVRADCMRSATRRRRVLPAGVISSWLRRATAAPTGGSPLGSTQAPGSRTAQRGMDGTSQGCRTVPLPLPRDAEPPYNQCTLSLRLQLGGSMSSGLTRAMRALCRVWRCRAVTVGQQRRTGCRTECSARAAHGCGPHDQERGCARSADVLGIFRIFWAGGGLAFCCWRYCIVCCGSLQVRG